MVPRGDTFELPVTVDRPLTGSEMWFTVKPSGAITLDDSQAVVQVMRSTGGIKDIDELGGEALVYLDQSATYSLPAPFVGEFDVQFREQGSNRVTTVLHGRCVITPDVTRRTA